MNQRQLFLQHVAQTSSAPLAIAIKKAKGCYFWDRKGKKYLDLISGIAVSSIGHGNRRVVKAVQKQASRYMHTMVYGEHIQEPQGLLAQKICELLPDNLNNVYFVNSGSEAIEGAMKLAKRVTGRNGFVAQELSYHGSTHGAMSLMSDVFFTEKYLPLLPSITFIKANDLASIDKINESIAGVIVEFVQAERGVFALKEEFIVALSKRCKEVGALLIADEIQTGMGRTGTLFAFQQYGIVPDILVLAKSFGAGMPLGCFIANKSLMDTLQENPPLGHITTFGGHPVSCAAAYAGLVELNSKNWVDEVNRKGNLFVAKLKHPLIKEIRQQGLMIAVDFGNSALNHAVIDACLENGLHVDWFLFNEQSMRICPPLIITDEEIKWACKIILTILNKQNATQ